MKLAISNIAWPQEDEAEIAELMSTMGIPGVEIAPTTIWENPLGASASELARYREFWAERGIEIVALQALLYGHPELTVFDSAEIRERTLDYLGGMMRLGRELGARVLVFGAPRNRSVGELSRAEADAIAVAFFRAAGALAAKNDVMLCIEPNPTDYGADFITQSDEGLALVRSVQSPGFGLHLDAAGMTLAGENPASAIRNCAGAISHFHASEPHLGRIGTGGIDHGAIASALGRIRYPHWVSAEMRRPSDQPVVPEIERVLHYLVEAYGGGA